MKKTIILLTICLVMCGQKSNANVDGMWFLNDVKVINSLLQINDFGIGCIDINLNKMQAAFYSLSNNKYRKKPIIVPIKYNNSNEYVFLFKRNKLYFKVLSNNKSKKLQIAVKLNENEFNKHFSRYIELFDDKIFYYAKNTYDKTPNGWLSKLEYELNEYNKEHGDDIYIDN